MRLPKFGANFAKAFKLRRAPTAKKRRLERAAVLLALTPLNIAQIAICCGYHNHSSFSRAFQRRYLLRPRNFRQPLKSALSYSMPNSGLKTNIQKASDRQMLLMHLYQAP
ncbi:helix-turn-helix domain-containing protein [Vreelandella glaciei]|uniref:helix-turn-helix domain-containing protein n=1 Tax=Vreelandella glaciei TaxID=186761 RepID=UPI0030EECD92